jgi:hypothetical protein
MYILAPNGVVEKASYSIGQLRKDNPQTSFPKNPSNQLLAEWDVFPVKPTQGPSVDYTKNVKEGVPVKQGADWVQVWEVTNATPSEIADRTNQQANSVRSERDQKLAACDWTQLPDAPVTSEKWSEWAEYRQALRDVPQQSNFPWSVTWPLQP